MTRVGTFLRMYGENPHLDHVVQNVPNVKAGMRKCGYAEVRRHDTACWGKKLSGAKLREHNPGLENRPRGNTSCNPALYHTTSVSVRLRNGHRILCDYTDLPGPKPNVPILRVSIQMTLPA